MISELETDNLLRNLYNDDKYVRLNAIKKLGESSDELCIRELKQILKEMNPGSYNCSRETKAKAWS